MDVVLPWVAAMSCVVLGLAAVWRRPEALASWCFLVGMGLLAVERMVDGRVLAAGGAVVGEWWAVRGMWVRAMVPGVWLAFSLVYARGNWRGFLWRWRWALAVAVLGPPVVAFGWGGELVAGGVLADGEVELRLLWAGRLLWAVSLVVTVGVIGNLEKTFRAAVGLARWRVKYLFLGVGLVFGVRVYVGGDALLFGRLDPGLATFEAAAVVLGCGLMGVGYYRQGFAPLDIHPSRAVLQGSLTVLLAGVYFVIVGCLAQLAVVLGGASGLRVRALVVLVGIVGLMILLLSDRLRAGLRGFVSRHFNRPQHDFRKVWTEFSRCTAAVFDRERLAAAAAEAASRTFGVLNVAVLLVEDEVPRLVRVAATGARPGEGPGVATLDRQELARAVEETRPFNLERAADGWAASLRTACPGQFARGGDRMAVPLVAGDRALGWMVLADRANAIPYSPEEFDLLECIGHQVGGGLRNCALSERVMQARELEAFHTLSTFFAHDLKNAANSLGLMLRNLPVHFDDPEFRADAVRGIGNTVERINRLVGRLATLRRELESNPLPTDLNELVGRVLDRLAPDLGKVDLVRELTPLPEVELDREQIGSVVTNLVVNAREAVGGHGSIRVATRSDGDGVLVLVSDDGCGMSAEFVRDRLFRPFDSTKSKGLGIGMFQCRKIIEAHRGTIAVDSRPGAGTCFRIRLPRVPRRGDES